MGENPVSCKLSCPCKAVHELSFLAKKLRWLPVFTGNQSFFFLQKWLHLHVRFEVVFHELGRFPHQIRNIVRSTAPPKIKVAPGFLTTFASLGEVRSPDVFSSKSQRWKSSRPLKWLEYMVSMQDRDGARFKNSSAMAPWNVLPLAVWTWRHNVLSVDN